jgi:peptidoglycan/xylan/chitin deacetylase (PgdA/CDA1 family)
MMVDELNMPARPTLFAVLMVSAVVLLLCCTTWAEQPNSDVQVPILVYHRFGPVVADSMTVTTQVFASHLQYLQDNGYSVIPLRQFVDYRLGRAPALPPRAVVITAEDGHRSVYTEMLALVQRYRVPVTLFIYPSAISNADYAMTWDQLKELRQTGLFDIESHTYWHPNFKKEKKRLAPVAYERFVAMQLTKSRETLERELHVSVDLLAWPFGIYDDDLIKQALRVGYIAGFGLERRHANMQDNIMALPRYLMTNAYRGKAFAALLAGGRKDSPPHGPVSNSTRSRP